MGEREGVDGGGVVITKSERGLWLSAFCERLFQRHIYFHALIQKSKNPFLFS